MELEIVKRELKECPDRINVLYRWLTNKEFSEESSEELCAYLLENKEYFDDFYPELVRAGKKGNLLDYRYESRQGKTASEPRRDKTGAIDEKHLAMIVFKQCRNGRNISKIEGLGYVLDYEMPICGDCRTILEKNGNLCPIPDPDPKEQGKLYVPGKCDLVSYDDNYLTILELKKESSKEPLIRAIMEAYTYKRLLNKEKAAKSLMHHYPELDFPDGNIRWRAALLLCKDGRQYKEYMTAGPKLLELMDFLEIRPIWYRYSDKHGFSVVK